MKKAVKIIDSGRYIEFWVQDTLKVGDERKKPCKRRNFDELNANEKVDSLQRKVKYYENKRWEIMRIINMNYDDRTSFLTLTFSDDIEDIDYSNNEFRKFIKRLCRYLYGGKESGLKYIATWEIQNKRAEKTGKNVIHYHMIMFDVPYISHEKLEQIWGNGYVSINKVDDVENKGLYISKYFAKDIDLKTHKKKAYFTSRNLKKPIEVETFLDVTDIEHLVGNEVEYSSTYYKTVPYYDQDYNLQFDRKERVDYYLIKKY